MVQEAGARPGGMASRAREEFIRRFGADRGQAAPTVARAPGRVNLIGEHTDYNDGFVFPMAIDREVAIAGRARSDSRFRLYSVEYGELSEFDLGEIEKDPRAPWSNYFRAVVRVLRDEGYPLKGVDAVVAGDVPQGAGLSSSAAFEVASATLLDALFGLGIEPARKALLCRRAENEFVGVACGIMDQFISAAGRAGHGPFLDCRSLKARHVPLHLGEAAVAVVNTNKRRGLVDSEYNTRRRECEKGLAFFRERFPGVRALRDVTPEQFESVAGGLEEPVRSRCRHVVTECRRVTESVQALEAGDLRRFGRLMDASHASLRDDYEVSCAELDAVVDIAHTVPGVYGARMTGGGFGGCAVILLQSEAVGALRDAIEREYPKRTGLEPSFFVFEAADGAGIAAGA